MAVPKRSDSSWWLPGSKGIGTGTVMNFSIEVKPAHPIQAKKGEQPPACSGLPALAAAVAMVSSSWQSSATQQGVTAATATMTINRKASTFFTVRSYQQVIRKQKVKRQLPYPFAGMKQQ